jgi:hypothetical protein
MIESDKDHYGIVTFAGGQPVYDCKSDRYWAVSLLAETASMKTTPLRKAPSGESASVLLPKSKAYVEAGRRVRTRADASVKRPVSLDQVTPPEPTQTGWRTTSGRLWIIPHCFLFLSHARPERSETHKETSSA